MEPGIVPGVIDGRALSRRRLLQLGVDISRLGRASAQLFRRDKSRAQNFTPAPHGDTGPTNPSFGRHHQHEYSRDRQIADFKASPTIGNIQDGTLDPWTIRFQDDEGSFLEFDSVVSALAEFIVFRHDGLPRAASYRKIIERELVILPGFLRFRARIAGARYSGSSGSRRALRRAEVADGEAPERTKLQRMVEA
jgi:hypothetical protein